MKRQFTERVSYDWSKDSIRLIITPSKVAKSIYFYVQEVGYFKTLPSYFTERNNLNSFLIVYTISGKGLLRYGNEEFILERGQCFYINCMDYHYYSNFNNEPWEFLWIHFLGNNALGYYEEFRKNGVNSLKVSDQSLFESTLRKIIAINTNRDVTTEALTSKLITVLLTELLIETSTNSTKSIFIPPSINGIMKDIDKNFMDSLSLDFFSDKYSISKYHLAREFKRYTGTTINEYIISTRISYAKELLKYSDLSIEEITYACGMNSESHFINLFKSRENTTPLGYRKEWML
ncbi:AraC-like DNA-binding protein [Mobilisporobacter senegalensis]|uniref:AraC-like DNA-binding protein n=1 Tax=Mobilisporobacter senegalensis TaxID=1329262 RepID=A0A3N1XC34_9FIRM|nr:AraC family transcriptional regulator [Mobilisporobacter senegalensis]ROR22317.1 AraC-like DNA-binding protein [Mobilisporobacter senegalensis]